MDFQFILVEAARKYAKTRARVLLGIIATIELELPSSASVSGISANLP